MMLRDILLRRPHEEYEEVVCSMSTHDIDGDLSRAGRFLSKSFPLRHKAATYGTEEALLVPLTVVCLVLKFACFSCLSTTFCNDFYK